MCAGYTLAGYVAVELTLFLNCRPFMGYFTIPPPQQECATYFNYEVVQAVFNISSDMAILLVIIPTLWKMNMSNKEKLPIVFIFGLGFFLVCARLFLQKDGNFSANLVLSLNRSSAPSSRKSSHSRIFTTIRINSGISEKPPSVSTSRIFLMFGPSFAGPSSSFIPQLPAPRKALDSYTTAERHLTILFRAIQAVAAISRQLLPPTTRPISVVAKAKSISSATWARMCECRVAKCLSQK